jgi:hypothetical protein
MMSTPRKALGTLVVSLVLTAALVPSSALALGTPGHEGALTALGLSG